MGIANFFKPFISSREQIAIEANEKAHLLHNQPNKLPVIRLIDRQSGQPQIKTKKTPHSNIFFDPYHFLIDIKWWKLFLIFTAIYLGLHIFFALLYWIGGEEGLTGNKDKVGYMDYFWFSVQTMTTIGYGHMSPNSTYINVIVLIESWISFFLEACMISLSLGKFSRPSRLKRNIHFSKYAVVHKKEDKNYGTADSDDASEDASMQTVQPVDELFGDKLIDTESEEDEDEKSRTEKPLLVGPSQASINQINKAFLRHNTLGDIPLVERKMNKKVRSSSSSNLFITFRCVNLRFKTQFVDTKLQLLCIVHSPEETDSNKLMQIYELDYYVHEQMEHAHVLQFSNPVLPIPWCITHQITAKSPLFQFLGDGAKPLSKGSTFEIICVLDGVDGATSDNYQARYSYTPADILMHCRFKPCVRYQKKKKKFVIDFSKFDAINFTHVDDILPL